MSEVKSRDIKFIDDISNLGQVREYISLFKKAEDKIKQIEKIRNALVIPAVNELRYSASHFIEFLERKDLNERREALQKAQRHCKRSIYDSVESGILYYLGEIKVFQKEFASVSLLCDKSYQNLLEVKIEAEDFIPVGSRNDDEKLDFYERSMQLFDDLQESFRLCEAKWPEYIKIKNKERNKYVMWLASFIIAICALVIKLGFF